MDQISNDLINEPGNETQNAGEHEHTHKSTKRVRVRKKRRGSQGKKHRHLRDRLFYYIIIAFGITIAILLTWWLLQVLSDPNIYTGVIKDT